MGAPAGAARRARTDPADTVLVHFFPCGPETEAGVLLSDGGRVHDFELRYGPAGPDVDRGALVTHWRDVTDAWQDMPSAEEIAEAFLWRPPPRRTALT